MTCRWLAGIPVFVLILAMSPAYGQSEQTTITDIENNPVAKDILQKIEQTKKWIVELEEKQASLIAESKELEEKRQQAKSSLESDLIEWENLWEQYSSENAFARFVDKIPYNATKSVFWNQFDFTQAKVQAGRDAFNHVINLGGDFHDAYAAYLKAAEIKKIEMIQVNSMYNIMHGLAYYNQQILFSPDGQFDLELSGEHLRKYYEDFRTNPQYLLANPEDVASREDLGTFDSSTECRTGYVLIHRNNEDDYVCVTERTAEMWQRHHMGEVVDRRIQDAPDIITIQQMNHDRIVKKTESINSKIQRMLDTHETKKKEMDKKYDLMIMQMEVEQKEEEKKVLARLTNDEISSENFSDQMTDIREKYKELEKTMIKEKFQVLEIMEKSHKQDLNILVDNYDDDPEIDVVWNQSLGTYNVVMST